MVFFFTILHYSQLFNNSKDTQDRTYDIHSVCMVIKFPEAMACELGRKITKKLS